MTQLREAAERYRANSEGMARMVHPRELPYTHLEVSTGAAQLCPEAWNRDAHVLARAYLAANPADDEVEIDEAWLVSVGFALELDGAIYVLRYPAMRIEWAFYDDAPPEFWIANFCLAHIKTRGQLRRLAAALNIPLRDATTHPAASQP